MYSVKRYIELSEIAKNIDHSVVLNEIKEFFGWIYNTDEMDNIGLILQIVVKHSKPMYLHGYVISSALHNFLKNQNNITILETGTARGFSSIIMANVLQYNNSNGIIHTIDYIEHDKPIFDNTIIAAQKKRAVSRIECTEKWKDVSNKFIKFHTGDSLKLLNSFELDRIHFAFLDGSHLYKDIAFELEWVKKRQQSGDVIICDDYTLSQYPEICKAVNNFLDEKLYYSKIFYGNDGTKKRGYVYMKKL